MSIIIFAVPAPSSVMLSSSIPNPIPPGSSVTLTCAVELSPAVDVPVTVNTVLTTPGGFTNTSTAMGSSTNYAATYVINSFRRSNSGNYACRATLVSMPTSEYFDDSNAALSSIVRVTTGKIEAYVGHILSQYLFQVFILH